MRNLVAILFDETGLTKILVKKVWQTNRSVKRLLILTTNLGGFVWQIADDLLNSSSFPLPNFPAIRYKIIECELLY